MSEVKSELAKIAEALLIFDKYDGYKYLSAEHDIIYAGDPTTVSEEDKKRLDELGWFVSEEGDDFFSKFV